MKYVTIKAFDVPDAWYKALRTIWTEGETFTVGYGSEETETKKLNLTIVIDHPENRPLLSDKAPNDLAYLNWYAGIYLWYPEPDDAEYTYGNRMRKSKTPQEALDELETLPIEELAKHSDFFDLLCKKLDEKYQPIDQLQEVINRFKQQKLDRQCTVIIRRPEDIIKGKVKDPPCLTMIDFEIIDDELCATVYFRSWDAYAGLPLNIAGLQMIFEFMASEIGVKTGKMILHSKNCHIYKRQYKLVERLFSSTEDSRRMVKKDVPIA